MLYLARKSYSFCFNGVDLIEFKKDEIYDLTGYPLSEIESLVDKDILAEAFLADESDNSDDIGTDSEDTQTSISDFEGTQENYDNEVDCLMSELTVKDMRDRLKVLVGGNKFNSKLISKMNEKDLAAAIVTFKEEE